MPSLRKQILNRPQGLLLLLMTLLIPTVKSSALVIKASAWPESLTVGDRFLYVNVVELQPGMEVEPVTPDKNFGDATLLSAPYRLEKSSANTVAYACTLAVYQPGSARIPTFAFRSSNSADTTTFSGDSLTLNIMSVLPADTAGLQIADIKGPHRLQEPLWPYFAIIAGVIFLIFAGSYLYRRFTGKITAPALPPVPPWVIANQRLDNLKNERHMDFGRFKQYYFELSMIIRGYIEGRYETLAVERTTYELEDELKLKTDIPQNLYDHLFGFFDRSDLVKFAKSIPTSEDAESDLVFAYDFVAQTKPFVEIEPEKVPEVKG